MPLRDHFHPPLSRNRHWENLHSAWANALRDHLNDELLPPEYFAEVRISVGDRVEVDVATCEEGRDTGSGNGGVAVWSPAKPFSAALDFTHPDLFEIQVYREDGGPRLVAAVEFVSPANKDRPATRRVFAVKCASYLHAGLGVAMIDIVTNRRGNLHADTLGLLHVTADDSRIGAAELYAASYRTASVDGTAALEFWGEPLSVGEPLPTLPLWIAPDLCLPLHLEAAYERACEKSRIGDD